MKNSTNSRRRTGSVLLEFMLGVPLIIFAACFALDLLMVLIQTRTVDLAARDAARAAAMAENQEEALELARAAVAVHKVYGVMPELSSADVIYKDNDGVAVPSSGPGPFVAVTVSSKLSLPFGGAGMLGLADNKRATRTYTFPLLQLSERKGEGQA